MEPIKAGICKMALGAIKKYGKNIHMIPCALTCYQPHLFRSKIIV